MSEEELLIQKRLGDGFLIGDEWGDMSALMAREDTCLKRSC